MLVGFVRIVLAGAAYLVAALLVLVSNLAIWGSFHHQLRRFGSPVFVFFLLTIVVGGPAYAAVTSFVRRVLVRKSGMAFHFSSVGVLYAYIVAVLVCIIAFPPKDGLEGGDIAVRLSLLVAAFGVVVNGLSARRQSRQAQQTVQPDRA